MDHARCTCPLDSLGARMSRNPVCALHGVTYSEPQIPYVLTLNDKKFLRSIKIAPIDSQDIEDVRKADEDRFKP
jgi:hypothetical protein